MIDWLRRRPLALLGLMVGTWAILGAIVMWQTHRRQTPAIAGDIARARAVFWGDIYGKGGVELMCGRRFATRDDYEMTPLLAFSGAEIAGSLGCKSRLECRRENERYRKVETDLHNWFPALSEIGRLRNGAPFAAGPGARPFAECGVEVLAQADERLLVPRENARGPLARAVLHIADRYQLALTPAYRELLEGWHKAYPPDVEERQRERAIGRATGVRNLWIAGGGVDP